MVNICKERTILHKHQSLQCSVSDMLIAWTHASRDAIIFHWHLLNATLSAWANSADRHIHTQNFSLKFIAVSVKMVMGIALISS